MTLHTRHLHSPDDLIYREHDTPTTPELWRCRSCGRTDRWFRNDNDELIHAGTVAPTGNPWSDALADLPEMIEEMRTFIEEFHRVPR